MEAPTPEKLSELTADLREPLEKAEHIIGHYLGLNLQDHLLTVSPTREELEALLRTLSAQSASAFDVKAQAIIMIGRLQCCRQVAEARAETAEAAFKVAREALEPFAKIEPVLSYDGADDYAHKVVLVVDPNREQHDFWASDIARAHKALSALQLPPEGKISSVGIPFAPQKEPSADTRQLDCEPSRGAWRPVDSAPRDGTHILACEAGTSFGWWYGKAAPARQTVVHWFGFGEDSGFYTSINELEPQHPFPATHWKPLDEPDAEVAPGVGE